jgi:hypothetical protein
LQQFPFMSCRVLCRKRKIGKATCLRVLHDDLNLEKSDWRHVPHSLEVEGVCQESRRKTPPDMMVHLDSARPHNSKKVRQHLLQQQPVKSLPELTVQIYLRVTYAPLECSRNECREHYTASHMNWFLL